LKELLTLYAFLLEYPTIMLLMWSILHRANKGTSTFHLHIVHYIWVLESCTKWSNN